jgi:hypothetical protein
MFQLSMEMARGLFVAVIIVYAQPYEKPPSTRPITQPFSGTSRYRKGTNLPNQSLSTAKLKGAIIMNARKTYGFILAGCLSANVLVLSTSVPGWAENPYRRGHRAPGSFANQRGNQGMTSAQREKEAQRLAHLKDKPVQSNGTFVRHPDIPKSGVDQKGGVYDNARRDNPDVQHPVNTARRDSNGGNGGYKPTPNQQQPFNIQPKATPQRGALLQRSEQQEERERERQARFAEFDEKYRENCKRTNKPDCTPPPHPTASVRGTSSYEEHSSN